MEYWNSHTCLTLLEGTGEQQMRVIAGSGCWSFVGYLNQTVQDLSIGSGCGKLTTMMHEIGHALGFWHTHMRHDRDDYIYILLNPSSSSYHNYAKVTERDNNNYGLPYDLGSVMHYATTGFSLIQAVDEAKTYVIGAQDKVSFVDLKMMNLLYNCQGKDISQNKL